MRSLLVAAVLLAGCTSGLPAATLTAELADGSEGSIGREYDPDARPTEALYTAEDLEHPDFYNVHDLVHEATQSGQMVFTTQFFSFGDGGGFFVCSIDGQPALDDGDCPADAGGFYEFRVGGEPADVGISDTQVQDGSTYGFVWTPL